MMIISVDPGVRVAGVAVFEDRELTSAWLAQGDDWINTASAVYDDLCNRFPYEVIHEAEIAIEVPQIYTQNKLRGDPNDLIGVALMAGASGAFIGYMGRPEGFDCHTYRPHEWKGQVPKDVMIERIKKRLSAEERKRVELPSAKSLQHNVWDSVGIGLYHLKRR